MPSYIPAGYNFKQAEFYKNEKGEVKDSQYITLAFADSQNSKEFLVYERLDSEENKYVSSGSGSLETIKINGVDADLSDGNNIYWAYNGTLNAIVGNDLSRDDVIKVAESMK